MSGFAASVGLLWDTSDFTPRWSCGNWTPLHGWTHVLSDLAVWGAYTCIPIILIWNIRRHPELWRSPLLWLFATFILACGATHAIEACIFWWPIYRIDAVAKVITAIVSWATVFVMVRHVPLALTFPGLQRVNALLREELSLRQLAEQKLGAREAQLEAIVESTPDALITIDATGKIESCNSAARRLFQCPGTELVGAQIDHVLTTEPLHEWWRRAVERGGAGVERAEFAVGDAGGRKVPVEATITPIYANARRTFLVQLRDITERKRAEERFRSVVECAPNAMIMASAAGEIVLMNARAEQLLGYPREELIGCQIEVLLPEAMRGGHARLRAGYMEHPEPRAMGRGRDLFARHKDGRMIPVEIGLNPLKTEQGTFVLSAIVDITERKRFEAELARQAEQLRQKNANLENRNQELDEFSYVASHDLQEPLRKLISFSKLLPDDLAGTLPEKAALDLRFITEAAQRMQCLIQDLLALSRAGRAAVRRESTRLDECVDYALAALATQVQERNPEIVRDPLPTIIGDRVLIGQLYQNLIGNALKFIAPGTRPVLHLTCEHENGELILGVRDNGIGLKPQYAETIFAPFKRLHGRDEYPGSGIGLSICRKVAELHGGRIWVESQLGEGAHFKFALRPGEVG